MRRLSHAYREDQEVNPTFRARVLEIAKSCAIDVFRALPIDWNIEDDSSTSKAGKDSFIP
jgi:hypothetical protein